LLAHFSVLVCRIKGLYGHTKHQWLSLRRWQRTILGAGSRYGPTSAKTIMLLSTPPTQPLRTTTSTSCAPSHGSTASLNQVHYLPPSPFMHTRTHHTLTLTHMHTRTHVHTYARARTHRAI
jgi:hypothetical protein